MGVKLSPAVSKKQRTIHCQCLDLANIRDPCSKKGFQMGIALPQFLLDIDGASGGILLLWIVGVCILLPLVIAVISLSRSSKYTGNYVMHQTLSAYIIFVGPKQSYGRFYQGSCELSLDPKNMKQEQAKFWKQHPAIVKASVTLNIDLTEILTFHFYLTRELAALSPALEGDFRRVLELAPRLLEELLKMAVLPRTAQGHGWLRPAVGVVELSQCIVLDILGQYSMVNIELFNIVEEVKKVSKAFVVLPKNVNAENAQSWDRVKRRSILLYRNYLQKG
ncbi:unnamed protein product [Brassica oleracea]